MEFSLNDPDHFLSVVKSTFSSPHKDNVDELFGCIVENCVANSTFTCPTCQQHYCNRHAGSPLMIARLSPNSGQFDPIGGEYTRICVYCYWESRPGYGPDQMVIQPTNHTDDFVKLRSQNIDKLELSMARIEKRLEKLSEYSEFGGGVGRVTFDEYCQRLIPWEPDQSTDNCRMCHSGFTFLNRRHHCRLCGLLICDSCSRPVPVRVLNERTSAVITTRSCCRCYNLLFKYHHLSDISQKHHAIERGVCKRHHEAR